ncbi:DEAD/DEAH box helicase family protein [Polycladomyces sp. WAk]|uniref:DEAD/DEAH box helicase family protein n=1 Tax=Polycladomyces zharkentensis TaxID=2807616 RepID=A0ABS2WF16_9BACL|nr:helicase-related protein [Polycladomyces sp. WAk]MBN2908000.1 DEAD/DEAH box helicase family protein [Polycladomyces sp. WAk]
MFTLYQATVRGEPPHWGISLAPEVDERFWRDRGREFRIAGSFETIGQAWFVLRKHVSKEQSKSSLIGNGMEHFEQTTDDDHLSPGQRYGVAIWNILGGRVLLEEEIRSLLRFRWGKDPDPAALRAGLQWLCLMGAAECVPAVEMAGPAVKWHCSRCGSGPSRLFRTKCKRCRQACATCDHCLVLGRCRSCVPLFRIRPPDASAVRTDGVRLRLPPLTPKQQEVASLLEGWRDGQERILLLWAATGAGKTEVCLPLVRRTLQSGQRVLWVTPRRDVVDELYPRLKKAVEGVRVTAVHGGTRSTWDDGELVIATAHQAWRMYRRYALAIVDEVDAYPLYGDPALQSGIDQALCNDGKAVWVTATPPMVWQRKARRGKLPVITLPARFHGHPLPVPERYGVRGLWNKVSRGKPVPPLSDYLRHLMQTGKPGLIFVPRVADLPRLLQWINRRYPSMARFCAAVSGKERNREEIVARFRRGRVRVLLSTTVLERGVTVPGCQVLVLGADHTVMDAATLVQMSGRAGRSPEDPAGIVRWISEEWTEAQRRAIREIKAMNRLASRMGCLHAPGVKR